MAILSRLETFGATPEQRTRALAIRCMVHLSAGLGQSLGGQCADAGAAVLVHGGLGYSTWSLAADGLYVDAT